jgi:hypothetical protein
MSLFCAKVAAPKAQDSVPSVVFDLCIKSTEDFSRYSGQS